MREKRVSKRPALRHKVSYLFRLQPTTHGRKEVRVTYHGRGSAWIACKGNGSAKFVEHKEHRQQSSPPSWPPLQSLHKPNYPFIPVILHPKYPLTFDFAHFVYVISDRKIGLSTADPLTLHLAQTPFHVSLYTPTCMPLICPPIQPHSTHLTTPTPSFPPLHLKNILGFM